MDNPSARRAVSKKMVFLGALEAVLGVLFYLWMLELLPIPPFPYENVLSALGFVALALGVYLLCWGGTLWQRAGDVDQWRETAARVREKFRIRPVLGLAVFAVLLAAEWVRWKTVCVTAALLVETVLFTLLFLPLLRKLRSL